MNRRPVFLITMLCFGFAFFYVPILSMIVFSFNDSRLATVWGGFSTRWYGELLENYQVIDAAVLSLQIATISASVATILGTMAGIALARFRRFRGRTMFSGLVTAPLVMPEVITGIASLMFFILMAQWIGWPAQRGFTTITLAHITFSMVFVTTVVQSRMVQADVSIEEAAIDLGSRPWQVLRDVTLPVISPAILSGWLLAFTISLDDVVISNFVTGPGNTTLPILIWSKVKLGVTPDINALATITVLIVGTGVAIAGVLMQRAEARKARDEQLAYRESAG
jgi:putrescine transport system permease protein